MDWDMNVCVPLAEDDPQFYRLKITFHFLQQNDMYMEASESLHSVVECVTCSCHHPPPTPQFSIIQSHLIGIISAIFPISCLDCCVWPLQLLCVVGNVLENVGGEDDSMMEVHERMILLLQQWTTANHVGKRSCLLPISSHNWRDKRC